MSLTKKGNKQTLNHLLNFKSYEPQQTRENHAKKSKQQTFVPFKKERFLQANYHFTVSAAGDYSENVLDPDLPIEWENVEQISLKTYVECNCPICLEAPTAAKVSRCGHVFCFVCIIRHLSYSPKYIGHCPICGETVSLKELKSVSIETVHKFNEGDTIPFTLLKRAKYSSIPLPKSYWNLKSESLPRADDPHTKFARFAIIENITTIIQRETKELQQAAWDAHSAQEDSIPFVEMAQSELESRQNFALQQERLTSMKMALKESEQSSEIKEQKLTDTAENNSPPKGESISWDTPCEPQSTLIIPRDSNTETEWVQEMEALHAKNNTTAEIESTSPEENKILPKISRPEKVVDLPDDFYYFYQASDAQQLFLHPLDFQILLQQYGSFEKLPDTIEAKIIELEDMSQTEGITKRYRFLNHLPLSSQFLFVEVDMRQLVSKESIYPHLDEIQRRIRRRKTTKRKDEEEKKRIEEEDKAKFANLNMQDFPSYIPNGAETDELTKEELEAIEKLEQQEMGSKEEQKPKTEPIAVPQTTNQPPSTWGSPQRQQPQHQQQQQSVSPNKPSFLQAAKSQKVYIPNNLPVKNSKTKGKQLVLLSTANNRRGYR